MFEEFLNKPVYIRKKDGFEKFGLLLEVKNTFLVIQFADSRKEYVAVSEIATIRENTKKME